MFGFVVKYLGFLKSVPLMAQLFDIQLRLFTLVTNAETLDALDDLEEAVLSWNGTSKTFHKYGGMQFNCNGREIGHIHSNGILDIPFDRKTKHQLLNEGKINHHHVFTNSGWISFYIKKREDVGYAKQLLRLAYLKINKC